MKKSYLAVCSAALLSLCCSIGFAAPITWGANGHSYDIVLAPAIAWNDARTGAQALGAGWDLATITSLDEQNFITSLLGPSDGSLIEYIIGGQYLNGAWEWVTGEAFVFTYWGINEPNGGAAEPYLALDGRYNNFNWGWNDYPGTAQNYIAGYVVESQGTVAVPEPAAVLLLLAALALMIFNRDLLPARIRQ